MTKVHFGKVYNTIAEKFPAIKFRDIKPYLIPLHMLPRVSRTILEVFSAKIAADFSIPPNIVLDAFSGNIEIAAEPLTENETMEGLLLLSMGLSRSAEANATSVRLRKQMELESNLKQKLSECGLDVLKILEVCRDAVQGLGIEGVNVYLLHKESGRLQSILRDSMEAASRYETPQTVLPGEKRYFIDSGLNFLIFDRLNIPLNISEEDSMQVVRDYSSDLKRYFGPSPHTEEMISGLANNLYVRFPTGNGYDVIIQANRHKLNKSIIEKNKEPRPLFTDKSEERAFRKTIETIGAHVVNEIIKAELYLSVATLKKRLELIRDLHTKLDLENDLDNIFEIVLKSLNTQFAKSGVSAPIGRSSIMIWDETVELLSVAANINVENPEKIKLKKGEGVAGTVFKTGIPMLVDDTTASEKIILRDGQISEGSFMSVPIYSISSDDKQPEKICHGVLSIRSNFKGAFTKDDLEHLKFIGGILGNAVSRVKSFTEDKLTGFMRKDPGFQKLELLFQEFKNKIPEARKITSLSVIFLDIDLFKRVNDGLGHGIGDIVLKGVAKEVAIDYLNELKRNPPCPGFNYVAVRFGGEELLIALANTPLLLARRIAEEIRERVKRKRYYTDDKNNPEIIRKEDGTPLQVTISGGVSEAGVGDDTLNIAIKSADEKLYRAKDEGRDRIVSSDPGNVEIF